MSKEMLTREEANNAKGAVDEIFEALPKSKKMEYIGHLNDVFLFLEKAARVLPSKPL